MSLCERGIDCLECSARGMCESYAKFKYNQALDDLVRLVCKYYTMQERAGYYADTNNMIKQRIADFAEELKR